MASSLRCVIVVGGAATWLASATRDSRASCTHARGLEMRAPRRLVGRFAEAGVPVPIFRLALKGSIIDLRKLDFAFPYLLDIPPSQIGRSRETRAKRLGAAVVRSSKVTDVEQIADHVRPHVIGPNGRRAEGAAYSAGCDGLRDAVRMSLGVPLPGFPNPAG